MGLIRYILPVLICGALTSACATPSPRDYFQKIEELRDAVGVGRFVDEFAAARFFTGIEAYQRGDFETACDELGRLDGDHAGATLQFAALSADGRCDRIVAIDDWKNFVNYQTRNLFVVNPGICGATMSGCSPVPREYIEAAAWDRAGFLNRDGGFHYYVAVELWDRRRSASIDWLRLAADAGNPAGQFALGQTLIRGVAGADAGVDAGFAYLEAAANQGFPAAEYVVAEYYYYGREPVQRDLSRAAGWYERAAEHGSTRAQYSLGVQYRLGEGVEQDETEALKWTILAARSGNPIAIRVRDELLSQLPAERVAVARQAANKWTQDHGSL